MLYALWTHYLKRYLSIPISKLTMLCHALLVIFPVPWGQILARDERQEQGQLEEEYAWAKRAGGMSIHSFYVPQQLSSTSWWHVSTVTVYGIECTQHLVDYSVSESMSSTNGSPSGLTIVFLSPAGGKFSDRRLKIRSQLTSGALFRYGGWRSNLWQQIIHRRKRNEFARKTPGHFLCRIPRFVAGSETIFGFPASDILPAAFGFENLWKLPLFSEGRQWQRSRKYIMTFPDN